MTTKITDLSYNLIAFIYQYLDGKDMVNASTSNRKMRRAFYQDFIYIELAKRDVLFIPSEGERFGSWKDYYLYLKQLKKNLSSGKPNVGYKMVPYRGHKAPIEAVEVFNHKLTMETTIVSGDTNGEVLTWNFEEDEDGDKLYQKDFIFKGDSKIIGIRNINEDANMLVWTDKNTFYYYSVNMHKKTEKNSERFNLIKEFRIENYDNPIKQIYYEPSSLRLFMSPDLSKDYKLKKIYSYNLKSLIFDEYEFNYNQTQSNLILNNNNANNNNQIGWNAFNNNNNNNNLFQLHPLIGVFNNNNLNNNEDILLNDNGKRERKVNYFVVTEDNLILYINKEPVKKRSISSYNSSNLLPNIFVFNKNTRISESYHIDFDNILNILPISNTEIALIGTKSKGNNFTKKIIMRIYNIKFFNVLREKVLYNEQINIKLNKFDVIYYKYPEMYYLINEKVLYKINNIGINQLKVEKISTLKEMKSINCIEADMFRIVLASDELYMSIFDLKTGNLWFNLLGGSKTVFPKSFIKHENYNGFHLIKITRNSIVSLIGNLIREYRFTFKYSKK